MTLVEILTRMMTILGQTGLYRITDDSFIKAELSAYADGLKQLEKELEFLRRERFLPTAESDGLVKMESITGREMEFAALQDRRDMLLYRLAVTPNDFTRPKIEQALAAVGIEANVTEFPQRLYINVIRLLNPNISRENIESAAAPFLPAHLPGEFDFLPQRWEVFDNQEMTWAQQDALDRNWTEFEEYGGN